MLKLYLDRGAREDTHGVMSVAGALFWPFFYEQFLHVWQPFLDGWGASAFHATDFYPGAREFWRKRPDGTKDPERTALFERDSRRLPSLIAPYVRKLFVVAFREAEFDAVAPLAWRERFGSVHGVAAQMMAQSVGFWATRENHDGEIAYFYENGDGDDEDLHSALLRTYRNPEKRAFARMASTPIGIDKGKARGLEVADFLSWHWNKYDAETRLKPAGAKRPLRKDIRALMDRLEMDGEKIDVRLFSGSALRTFLVEQGCTIRRAS